MWKDPIVEEVRAIREKLWREWKVSPGGITRRQREVFDQWKGKKVTAPFHSEWQAPHAKAVAEDKPHYATKKGKGA